MTTPTTAPVPPGWFPDPAPGAQPGAMRYFDGTAWTQHTQTPTPPPPSYQQYPPSGPYQQGPGPQPFTYYAPPALSPTGHPLASWGQRVGAYLLDGLILGVPLGIIWGIVAATTYSSYASVDPVTGQTRFATGLWLAMILAVALASFLYFAVFDGQNATPGKRIVGIAVRSATTGAPIGFGRALGRWTIYTVCWMVFYIPGILCALWPLWDPMRQGWHDKAVGSVVVRTR